MSGVHAPSQIVGQSTVMFNAECMKESKKEIIVNKNGPVIIIEDDADDQDFLTEIFQKLNYQNKILFFRDGQEALDHINVTDELPFLILSDINMPKLNGRHRCIQPVRAGIFRKTEFDGRAGENHQCDNGVLETLRSAK